MGRIDAKEDKIALKVIKEHGFCRVRIFLLESQELPPDGLGVLVFVKDAPLCLLTQEHGTGNGRKAPDTTCLSEKDTAWRLVAIP